MSSYQPVEGIRFDVGQDKASAETRVARGTKVTGIGPESPLYQENEIKTGVDAVVAGTAALKQGVEACAAASIALRKARSELSVLTRAWDRSYELLVAAGEKRCVSVEEGTGLGLSVRSRTSYVFARPLGIVVKHNVAKGVLRIHVQRAPGAHSLCVQVSRNAADPEAWSELAGDGAIHEIQNPEPGTWSVRAQSRSAKARSEFTEPVTVIVK